MKNTAKLGRSLLGLTASTVLMLGGMTAQAEDNLPPQSFEDLNSPSDMGLPTVACALFTDVAKVGDSIIAVGERGHIVKAPIASLDSADAFDHDKICARAPDAPAEWKVWEQIKSPTRAFLNTMSFIDDKTGWIAGHDSVIMKTTDGGDTWKMQHKDPKSETPWLDILFLDEKRGFAVGTYGAFLHTYDGGQTWARRVLYTDPEFDEEDDFHLNGIARLGDGSLFVVGEAGALYRSDDRGESWVKLAVEYEGSFFQVVPVGVTGLVIVGMRGNAFVSNDSGDNFTQIDTNSVATFLGAASLPNGEVIFSGLKGAVFVTSANGTKASKVAADDKTFTGVVPIDQNRAVLISDQGIYVNSTN